ncbi:MAG: PDZ domain-containing protein, partial [Steroidobacteraceae bacterium]
LTTTGAQSAGVGRAARERDGAFGNSSADATAANDAAGRQAAGSEFTQFAGTGLPAQGAAPAQQRANQLEKISRGLSAASGGGVAVDEVLPSSVAGKLGLRPGDVIVAVNGTPVDSPASFAQLFETDGMPRQLDAVRDGRAIHLHL